MTPSNTSLTKYAPLLFTLCTLILTACGGNGGVSSTHSSVSESSSKNEATWSVASAKKEQELMAVDSILIGLKHPVIANETTIKTASLQLENDLSRLGMDFEQIFGSSNTSSINISGDYKLQALRQRDVYTQRIYKAKIPSGMSVEQAIQKAYSSGAVEYAEPNYLMHKLAVPNDPEYSQQWHLNNTGQSINGRSGLAGFDIRAQNAWDISTGVPVSGQPAEVIAVIDDGVFSSHPDLADNIWVPPAGTITDFGDNDVNSIPCSNNSHGTNVAGVIAAKGNNGIGIAGVSWASKIMAVKVESCVSGQITTASLISALNFVKNQKLAGVNVRIANISLGNYTYSSALKSAGSALSDAGILAIIAAGNENNHTSFVRAYPGAYRLPNQIVVGATNNTGAMANFSNYGRDVDIAAPGESIRTTDGQSSYATVNGTSFSAPIVAGIAALIWTANPTLTMAEVKNRILARGSATLGGTASALNGIVSTNRHINASRSLSASCLNAAPVITNPRDSTGVLVNGARHLVNVLADNCTYPSSVSVSLGSQSFNLKDDGVYPDDLANDGVWTTAIQPNTVNANLTLTAVAGGVAAANSIAIQVIPAYNYVASTSGVTAYSSIRTTGTKLLHASKETGANLLSVNNGGLPFPIKFAKTSFSQIIVSSEGRICFGSPNSVSIGPGLKCSGADNDTGKYIGPTYRPLPTGKQANESFGFIAPLWADWDPTLTASGGVFIRTTGSAPNRSFIVSWEELLPYNSPYGAIDSGADFQVVFYENQEYFDIKYGNGGAALTRYVSGVQHLNGQIGTQLKIQNSASSIGNMTNYRLTPQSPTFNDTGAWPFVTDFESLKGSRITTGYNNNTQYRPDTVVLRWMMSAFIMRSLRGNDDVAAASYVTPTTSPFSDVAPSHDFYKYIYAMREEGISNGWVVGANREYRPDLPVTREAMAAFMLRAIKGSAYVPLACSGTVFLDVNCSGGLDAHIEEFARFGITNGWDVPGGKEYRPLESVYRGHMAAFLQRAFRYYDYY